MGNSTLLQKTGTFLLLATFLAIVLPNEASAEVCLEEVNGICIRYGADPAASKPTVKKKVPAPPKSSSTDNSNRSSWKLKEEKALKLTETDIFVVQRRLKSSGFYKGPIDGLIGGGTRKALRQWQKSKNLPATGYLNALSYKEIGQTSDFTKNTPKSATTTKSGMRYFSICGKGGRKHEYDTAYSNNSLNIARKEASSRWSSCANEFWASKGECISVALGSRGAWTWRKQDSKSAAEALAKKDCEQKYSQSCEIKATYCTIK